MPEQSVNIELNHVGFAVIATFLLLCCYPIMMIGAIFLIEPLSIKGTAIYFIGLSMEVGGTILGRLQREQLTKNEILKQVIRHFGFGFALYILIFSCINFNYYLA